MTKKSLLLAGIMCSALVPALVVAHRGECDCEVKNECAVDKKAQEEFIVKTLVEYYAAKMKAKMLGKKAVVLVPDEEAYNKAVVTINLGGFESLIGDVMQGLANFAQTIVETEVNGVSLDDVLDFINSDIKPELQIVLKGKKDAVEPTTLKEEMKKEESDEKLVGQV